MFAIDFTPMALEHFKKIEAYDRRRLLDAIEKQLTRSPDRSTKKKKILEGLEPPWNQTPPVWQLRVGDYRVFYDVDGADQTVTVHAVLYKGRKTTGDIL